MSAVFSTSAAQRRPFVFETETDPEVCPRPSAAELFGEARPSQRVIPTAAFHAAAFKDARLAGIAPASQLSVRSAPEMVSSGIAAIDILTGGLPRGCLTEICGSASSGRSTFLLAALAAATRRGEYCAVVDASDAFDPQSAADAGIELDRLLWVRCGGILPPQEAGSKKYSSSGSRPSFGLSFGPGSDRSSDKNSEKRLEQLLRVADLLLESGGFGMIALDLGDIPPQNARRIPLATWFRFRRAVEPTPTVLLAVERQAIAGNCSSLRIKLGFPQLATMRREMKLESSDSQISIPAHADLLTEVNITAELLRSKMERKPVRSAEVTFAAKTAWAG
jgi:hypothetical protein